MQVRGSQVLVVEPALAGVRLLDLLARAWPDARSAELRGVVASGDLTVNGVAALSDRALRSGDVVIVSRSPMAEAPRARRVELPVLYESSTAMVVHKPAGLTTVPDRSGRETGVHGELPALRPADDLRIVHRLDRDTSGCLLLAKGAVAARHFDASFQAGAVAKTYLALVHGVPARSAFPIDAWLGPDPARPGKVVVGRAGRPRYREALTEVVVREVFSRHALLELHPRTGRTHQIRVHLQSVGHPIVGDADYGGDPLLLSALKGGYKQRKGVAERPLCARMFLHAAQLACSDVDGTRIAVAAALPEDLQPVLRQLHKLDERRKPLCD